MKKLMSLLLASSMLLTVIPVTDYSYATTNKKTVQPKTAQPQVKTKAQLEKEKKAKAEKEKKLKAEQAKCDEQLNYLRKDLDNLSFYQGLIIEAYVRGLIGLGTYDDLMEVTTDLSSQLTEARSIIKKTKKPMPLDVEETIVDTMLNLSELMLKIETLIEADKE